jgi:hypothetical protein
MNFIREFQRTSEIWWKASISHLKSKTYCKQIVILVGGN